MPWRSIKLGVSNKYLEEENAKALAGVLTEPCCAGCAHLCGVCSKELQPRERPSASTAISKLNKPARGRRPVPSEVEASARRSRRILFAFRKTGKAAFLGHLDVAQVFERAFLRAGYKVEFTKGFNPKPRLEFAQPISLGLESQREIALIEVLDWDDEESFRRRTNDVLPEGIQVVQAKALQLYRVGEKKHSLMSLYWGSEFSVEAEQPELLDALAERISAHRDELSAVVDRFSRQGGSADIVIRQPEKGSGNVLNLLKRMGFSDPLQEGFRIVRKRQFAQNRDVPSQVTDYFESSVLI